MKNALLLILALGVVGACDEGNASSAGDTEQEGSCDCQCGEDLAELDVPLTDSATADIPEVCDGSAGFCECIAAFDNDSYCSCVETEGTAHPGEPLWCMCHLLVCVNAPEPALADLYLADCIESYPQDCL